MSKVAEYAERARGIAWDTCHKIYILMDDEQMRLMAEYGYDPLISADEMSPADMHRTINQWYEDSCELRFVSAVRSVADDEDPNLGFEDIIPQAF